MKENKQKYKLTGGTSSVVMDTQGKAINAGSPRLNNAIITYQISRLEIEKCITRRIVHDLRAEPGNPLIWSGMDTVIFCVHGYDRDRRELFMIPSFRKYIAKVHEQNPGWIYYANLDSHWLKIIAMCLFQTATAVTKKKKSDMFFLATDVADFIAGQLAPFFTLCEISGVRREDADDRIRAVCESFGVHPPKE